MKTPSQEDLLGYVLGALDAQEHRDVQQLIDQNPEIEEQLLELKSAMLPLDCLDTAGPRVGLARRTCEFVANQSNVNQIAPNDFDSTLKSCVDAAVGNTEPATDAEQPAARLRRADRLFHPTSWSIPDVLVGIALLAIVAGILFPAISMTRYNSRLIACQDNLVQLGAALMSFSSVNEGKFVSMPSYGNLATIGCFGPILKDAGFLKDDSLLACPGVTDDALPVHIPSCDQVNCASCEVEINHYRRTMAGHYGYTMGYCENDRYCPPRNMGRTNVVLVADQPSLGQAGRQSMNHAGYGQNCLFEDGRVEFVRGHTYGRDAIFENDYGIVGPGTNAFDNVIAASHLSPSQSRQLLNWSGPNQSDSSK